jgi:hypothetical protein
VLESVKGVVPLATLTEGRSLACNEVGWHREQVCVFIDERLRF